MSLPLEEKFERAINLLQRWVALCGDSVAERVFDGESLDEHRRLMRESLALILPKNP